MLGLNLVLKILFCVNMDTCNLNILRKDTLYFLIINTNKVLGRNILSYSMLLGLLIYVIFTFANTKLQMKQIVPLITNFINVSSNLHFSKN